LFEAYWEYFRAARERREWILANPGYVDEVLAAGALKAREEASKVISRVRKAVGLI
jgi:tryptophanyl-tRNA synthetase